MLMPRLVPCLDVDSGRVVKGTRFQGLRNVGYPAELAQRYCDQGADELVLLDVSATTEGRAHAVSTVEAVRRVLSIPLTVGGGVRAIADAERLLAHGADKVAVNTMAVERPALIGELADRFGRQCVVLALDARRAPDGTPEVVTHAGSRRTGLDAVAFAQECAERGAGEILLTSWDRDGTGSGYDLELVRALSSAVPIPVVASGGAGSVDDLVAALAVGASAVLVASLLHDGHTTVDQLKSRLRARGVEVRP
jgi:imidazole glycerol-phosphate synthase subunit HisF